MKKTSLLLLALLVPVNIYAQAEIFHVKKNTLSNVEFYVSNHGKWAHNDRDTLGGLFWPRGSQKQYVFSAGLWFGTTRLKPKSKATEPDSILPYVDMTVNPISAAILMTPGRIEDGDTTGAELASKYAVKLSTSFDQEGSSASEAKWPVWDARKGTVGRDGYFGSYVHDESQRSSAVYSKGPAFYSDEDIFVVYKDTDLRQWSLESTKKKAYGYPLRLQYEQSIYSWRTGHPMQDAVIIRYSIINHSSDTLRQCLIAPVLDPDIGAPGKGSLGGINDRVRYLHEADSLDCAIAWTGPDSEDGKNFGYMGMTLLESPAVDAQGYLRTDKPSYTRAEQLGLRTYYSYSIIWEPGTDSRRYSMLNEGDNYGGTEIGDIRMLMSSGPFSMRPGERVHLAYALVFANTASGKYADGTAKDIIPLVNKVKTVRSFYSDGAFVSVDEPGVAGNSGMAGVFPQPLDKAGYLRLKLEAGQALTIELYNSLGNKISRIYEGTAPEEDFVTALDGAGLPAGVYYCIVTGEKSRMTVPFIISH